METTRSVGDTISLFLEKLSESTGYKYLKSSKELKKTVGPMVFEILLFSSQWNDQDSIRIEIEFSVSYKKYGKLPCDRIIASKDYTKNWFDITTEEKFNETFNFLDKQLHENAVDLSDRFSQDFNQACQYLLDEKFYEYDVYLDFLVDMLGKDKVEYRIKEMIQSLDEKKLQQVEDYKNGAKNQNWMLNRGNLRYIVDQGYM